MLGMLALMAVTTLGADEALCARVVEEAAVQRMIAAAEIELYEAEVYAAAAGDFDAVLEEAGLAGSTLAREAARATSGHADTAAFARNR